MTSDWQTWQQPQNLAAFEPTKESKLKLSLETRNHGDVFIVHCHGRIVYRDEAAALAQVVAGAFARADKLVLDLTGVTSIDSAGIGELALFHNRAQEKKVAFKCAGANSLVRKMLGLTNLDTVLEIHPSLDDALGSFREEEVCADC